MKIQQRSFLFWIGIVLLVVPGVVHAYLLMPFPGSQELNAITVSYYLEKVVLPLRIAGAVLIVWYLAKYFLQNSLSKKIFKGALLILCLVSFYFTDFMFKAETMFEEPQTINFANALFNKVPESAVIIGVVNNGVAKAYPIVYLGYHHKVQDNVGNEPLLVTYCTMCRTGRVYSPIINGVRQNFRLVGARHYNAIIEDAGTKTWWYQSTGSAAVGKLKGTHLKELPYEQSTLGAWLKRYPASLILQPDKHYLSNYNDLKNYDRLQVVDKDSTLKNKDTLIRKSWVVGLIINGQAKAYDWRRLDKRRLLNDRINKTQLLLTMEEDSLTYHAFNCSVNGKPLHFKLDTTGRLIDQETASLWDWDGLSTAGMLKGKQLDKIQAYQEYWHSWKHFHPNTLFWKD
ncbi:DUF3179 domain-containing (seleno)protein [Mucilaginibacter sp. SP1R1]|uniref:DUF3179 domain-containing (seleno)protein n=1 Tax=Mucilaginibacter sp. SP1R1 TaxID=2723091 RepID=UPI00160952FA|nr:DUF3179 domain-containing (seleno)protein [Mucilaginibacter sp. SP1R1]MBB6151507.1 hypothetical protein [Mucilaginibacter sp. SP1R1]